MESEFVLLQKYNFPIHAFLCSFTHMFTHWFAQCSRHCTALKTLEALVLLTGALRPDGRKLEVPLAQRGMSLLSALPPRTTAPEP